jgi:hypothetical protein
MPKYIPVVIALTQGSIKAHKIYTSTDDTTFTEICAGERNGIVYLLV